MADDKNKRIGELEDQLKRSRERIAELRDELDELRERQDRMREHVEESDRVIESWCETFGMELTDDSIWTWKPFWDEYDRDIRDYNALLNKYNALVRDWNTFIAHAKPTRHAFECSDLCFVLLKKIRRAGILIKGPSLEVLHPDSDQVARDIVAFGKAVKCLAGNEVLGDLPFELDAMGAVLGQGFHPLKAR
jgi:hypothetical protein